jgi:hypothetical protein
LHQLSHALVGAEVVRARLAPGQHDRVEVGGHHGSERPVGCDLDTVRSFDRIACERCHHDLDAGASQYVDHRDRLDLFEPAGERN